MRKMIVAAVAAALALALAAPAVAAKPSWAEAAKPGAQNIVEIATSPANADSFNVLVAAVSRAGLVPMLSGKGAYTVFAPTDAAFEATFGAGEGAIIAMINNGDLDGALGDILGYHVMNGRRHSNSVLAAKSYKMLNGDKLTKGELVNAGVVPADISAVNGIIHILTEGVLLPEPPTIPQLRGPPFTRRASLFARFDVGTIPTRRRIDFDSPLDRTWIPAS